MNHRSLAARRFAVPCAVASLVACAPAASPPTAAPCAAPSSLPPAASAASPSAALPGPDLSPERRAEELVARMTLEEKIDYIGGDRGFYIRAVPRLGIPEVKMSDGPSGCRNWGPSTAYTAAMGLAATFDRGMAERVGASIGRDCRARGVDILLAPGVNIQRSPRNGRNFEYLGEDPFLAGEAAAAYVRGVRSAGVLATVKHFAANNQEWDRRHVSSEVDERTLREIYFPAFERVVRDANVGAVMTAYNLLNGTYCSENAWLLSDVLEKQWGFSGFVMSDWHAVQDVQGTYDAGLDLEMPDALYMNRAKLEPLLARHALDPAELDAKVKRILRTIIAAGFFDRPKDAEVAPLDDPRSDAVALAEARSSLVLLKNAGGLLPLDRKKVRRIAVIGPNATPAVAGGSGSAYVTPFHTVSLLDGITRDSGGAEIDYHPGVRRKNDEVGSLGRPVFDAGVRQEIFAGRDFAGPPVATATVDRIDFSMHGGIAPVREIGAENYSIRWTGTITVPKAGKYRLITNSDDGIRVFFDENKVIDDWHDHPQTLNRTSLDLKAGPHAVVVEYFQATGAAVAQLGFAPEGPRSELEGRAEVEAIARKADVVVVAVGYGQSAETNSWGTAFDPFWPPPWARQGGLVEAEDSDRPFGLPPEQLETIRVALAANPRSIIVVNAGGGIDMQPFVDRAGAILWAWYPGQEGGRAAADVLFGDVSPSGKLPVTLAKRYADYPSAASYDVNQGGKTPYAEGIFVGYRGFDENRVAPAFPFGFGLSYTSFEYSDLHVAGSPDGAATATLRIKNRGPRPGDEIAEVYVAPPKGPVPRAPKELKGFARVSLLPGESKEVAIALDARAFAYWDDKAKAWTVAAGTYGILAGTSSADLALRGTIDMSARVLP